MELVERVKRLLVSPAAEWQVIDAEPATPESLYKGYVIPLAAIGPVARLIGYSVFGVRIPFTGTVYRAPIGSAIVSAVVTYLASLAAVYVFALIIDALAPSFGATKSPVQALKVAVYSSTAGWLAGIFSLIPGLRMLGLLGLYSLYLLYVGLPLLMKAPSDKALSYTVVVIVAGVVLFFILGAIGGRMMGTALG